MASLQAFWKLGQRPDDSAQRRLAKENVTRGALVIVFLQIVGGAIIYVAGLEAGAWVSWGVAFSHLASLLVLQSNGRLSGYMFRLAIIAVVSTPAIRYAVRDVEGSALL